MCVIGLVTLMLNKPATQRRNPKVPVTRLPITKTRTFQTSTAPIIAFDASKSSTRHGSPLRTTKGATKIAEPKFVQYAK